MSIEYCYYCDEHIDTDFNSEHFILNGDLRGIASCIKEEQDKEVNQNAQRNRENRIKEE